MEGFELNVVLLKCIHVVDSLSYRTTKAVQTPDHPSVAWTDLDQKLIEFGSGFKCAGSGDGEDAVAAGCVKCVVLEYCVLIAGGDSGVPEKVSQRSVCIKTRK